MGCFRGFSSVVFLLPVVVVVVLCCAVVSPVIGEDDVKCLQGVKASVGDPSKLSSWSFANNSVGFICNFVGATCWNETENRLIGLNLQDMTLRGQIPSALQYCFSLQTLDLSGNNLYGSIPSDICTWLPYLVTLDLSNNQHTGRIPVGLANCSFLNKLMLSGNKLSGAIPDQLSGLRRLKDFSVANNDLSGAIPSGLRSYDSAGFDGNKLCGAPLGKCGGSSRKSIGIIVAAGVSGAAASLLLGFVLVKVCRPKN